jgi:hypothetical protein
LSISHFVILSNIIIKFVLLGSKHIMIEQVQLNYLNEGKVVLHILSKVNSSLKIIKRKLSATQELKVVKSSIS